MATSEKKRKKETITKKNFLKWNSYENFDYEVDEKDNIIKLKCKVCCTNLQQIRVQTRKRNVRGTALDSLLKYADGISYAHKGNVDKHVKSGGFHDCAKQKFQGNVTEQPKNVPVVEKNQQTLQDTIQAPSNIANYRRLFVTALHIAMKEKPISDFKDLIELQQKNGLKFLQGKSHEKASAEFIDVLADTLKKDIKLILLQVSAFSLAFDGSQPRKTGTEKELLYSKCALRGEAVELLLECIHVDDYGGDNCDVKCAIDDVILT